MSTGVLTGARAQTTGIGDGVRQLVDVSPLLPVQWQPCHDGVYATPAGHLFAAVLESAVHEFELYRRTTNTRRAAYAATARAWFVGDPRPCWRRRRDDSDCRCDACWPLSFVNCCAALGIDPDKLRSKLFDQHADGRALVIRAPGRPAGRCYRVAIVRGAGRTRVCER